MTAARQIAIVLSPDLTALHALGPYEVLKLLPGAEIRFVAREPGPVVTDRAALVVGATHSFEETPRPYLVLVPGSEANTTPAMANGRMISGLQRVHAVSTWTASVCSGSLILAAAGLLEGKPAISHWWALRSLSPLQCSADICSADTYSNERVVRSGKIWTAAGVSAGLDLALALVDEIAGREQGKARAAEA